jgi:Family of unknown function (DUF6011)
MTETTQPRLRARRAPVRKVWTGSSDGPASDAALAYFRVLGHERECGMTPEDFDTMLSIWREGGIATAGFISEQIDEYKALPKRPVKSVEPGYYVKDGNYYVVVKTKDGQRTYAKQLIPTATGMTWEYKKGAVAALGALTPLTVEEAAKWGHLHGRCIICCRPLTDPTSVKAGIGPICAKRLKK